MENGHEEVEQGEQNPIVTAVMEAVGGSFNVQEWMQELGLEEALPDYAEHMVGAIGQQAMVELFMAHLLQKEPSDLTVTLTGYLKSALMSSFHAGMVWEQNLREANE